MKALVGCLLLLSLSAFADTGGAGGPDAGRSSQGAESSSGTRNNAGEPPSVSDEVGTGQSSTTTSDCVTVKNEGKLCGKKAMMWCNDHDGAKECKGYKKSDTSYWK
jgi:hypothetical protein